MPHSSHKKKTPRPKRTETLDADGWTRVSSYHTTTNPSRNGEKEWLKWASDQSRLDPHRVADGMTKEKLLERYNMIEKKWHASESCTRLCKTLHEAIRASSTAVESCICFGTGSMSGLRQDWIHRHDVALFQIAAFKTAVDTIERAQSRRPTAYAQEPAYNVLDTSFLDSLQIVKVDSPGGWDLIDPSSFTYCPGAEQFVSIMIVRKDPGFYMGGPLPWLRDRQIENAFRLPSHCDQEHSENEQQERLQMIDKFMDEHDVYSLPDLDAADHPFYDQVLYCRKLVDG